MTHGSVDASTLAALRVSWLFAGFSDDEIGDVASAGTRRTYSRGAVLWDTGDEGREIIVVLTGELAVWGTDDRGEPVVIAHLGPGECLGEIALLLESPRSARVTCSRPASVLALGDAASALLRDDPRALRSIARSVSDRLARLTQGRTGVRAQRVVGIAAHPGTTSGPMIAASLARLLTSPDASVVHVRELEASPAATHELIERVLLGERGPCETLVVELPPDGHAGAASCDVVVDISRERDEGAITVERHTRMLRVLESAVHGAARPVNSSEPFLLPHDSELERLDAGDQVNLVVDDLRRPVSRVVHRLARSVLGGTVGVALGGGAAFGMSHIGVLAELEAAGIPIDLVAGTSMGSFVGMGYASGLSTDEMLEIAGELASYRTIPSVVAPALTGNGLLGGRRLMSTFSRLMSGDKDFTELVIPGKTVATDIETGERVDIGEGSIRSACRASSSVPVIFAPARRGERVLVDGAMVDPVPVRTVRDMGADIVIAVNVVPRLERGVTTSLQRMFGQVNRFNPLTWMAGSAAYPDFVDVLMNSLQAIQYELGAVNSGAAEAAIAVDLAGFTWIEFSRTLEIVERGREATKAAMPVIREALDSRLAGVAAAR